MNDRDIEKSIVLDVKHYDEQVVKGRVVNQVNIVNGVRQERQVQEPDTIIPERDVATFKCPNCNTIFDEIELDTLDYEKILSVEASRFGFKYCPMCGQRVVLYSETIVGEIVKEDEVKEDEETKD